MTAGDGLRPLSRPMTHKSLNIAVCQINKVLSSITVTVPDQHSAHEHGSDKFQGG